MSSQYWPEISSSLKEILEEIELINHSKVEQKQVDMLKNKTTKILEELKLSLDKQLDLNYSSLVQFAVVSFVDEELQRFVHTKLKIHWSPLQQELFGAHNAGEIFYKSCDDMLEDSKTPSIVYEVFYFILKCGFKGRYKDTKTQIYKYLDLLKERIGSNIIKKPHQEEKPVETKKKSIFKPQHYYMMAASASIIFFCFLFFQSNLG